MEINMTDMIQQNSPLVFLGSSSNLELWVELAERAGVTIIGIIDSDYFGNTDNIAGIPIIGATHSEIERAAKACPCKERWT